MLKIRKGDQVVVIAGRDKGKRGEVAEVLNNDYLLVNGVNQVKRHTRPNPMQNQPGGILTKEAPIHVSNVAIWNAAAKKADRVGFKVTEVAGEKTRKARYFKSNGEQLTG
ncbi:MAG: 50S ribosomal protein L24 [Burkholderiales bacterium]|jgi:large subunit ribosomal protein L24|nr:50S ribosomal protein L24 [Burkholderiales bacterium]